jgi:hypothetical protein
VSDGNARPKSTSNLNAGGRLSREVGAHRGAAVRTSVVRGLRCVSVLVVRVCVKSAFGVPLGSNKFDS